MPRKEERALRAVVFQEMLGNENVIIPPSWITLTNSTAGSRQCGHRQGRKEKEKARKQICAPLLWGIESELSPGVIDTVYVDAGVVVNCVKDEENRKNRD